ncbi:stage III sporulation protein AG [Terribacillus saccharophilus]|uniref:Stage III sporulation protein AG n=1 Tax=Terribacillus saccharophilus TaxID=361277 RepID=A0A075LK87_9BACI|nr:MULTISPECIES: stage III sporulation protein AG [Terribacillus]AIF66764.1 stage III sporulation protein AG [Terribacillus goriensis]MCM3224526.1 stage III sporulation protein AG [Terribacillus saccharophilus]MEC0283578.1 stage III sporulation protein AG [Terribacillus saccharophilus]MEC0290534.1 stage III sporulation protein AG [Terribacillus saccharophilus]PAF38786.1 stage III sporulation protein AG [Terribacillus saccharophilus]
MKKLLDKLSEQWKLKDSQNKKPTKLGYLVIVGLLGALLLLVSGLFTEQKEPDRQNTQQTQNSTAAETEETFAKKENDASSSTTDLEAAYEQDLVGLLEKIKGVSEVEVMVNLNSTHQKIYEKNLIIGQQTSEETDQNGGERVVEDENEEQQVVLVRQGDQEVPLLVETRKPEVRGVLVVAKGAEQATVQEWVVQAVSRVLDVPTHRISVMPKN